MAKALRLNIAKGWFHVTREAGIENYYVTSQTIRRMVQRLKEDRKLLAVAERVLTCTKVRT
jgi:hypothetical protein